MESMAQEYSRESALRSGAPRPREARDGFDFSEAANDKRISKLARAIEQEIIPRLMLAHRAPLETWPGPAKVATLPIRAEAVRHFAKVVLAAEDESTLIALAAYREEGTSTESLYLDLLAPTARYLGELWEEDLCSFTDVTIGLGRLQRILRELSPDLASPAGQPGGAGRRVLLLPSPGEQHTLGLVMVGEFFRSAGWTVSGGAWHAELDAAQRVESECFDVVGFSLGAEAHLAELAEMIRAVRQGSRNPDIAVLVGGPIFSVQPHLADWVGADGMTIDGKEAPVIAERLVARRCRRGAIPGE